MGDSHLQFPLYRPHPLPVASSESPFLLTDDDFDVPRYPWLVIWKTNNMSSNLPPGGDMKRFGSRVGELLQLSSQ